MKYNVFLLFMCAYLALGCSQNRLNNDLSVWENQSDQNQRKILALCRNQLKDMGVDLALTRESKNSQGILLLAKISLDSVSYNGRGTFFPKIDKATRLSTCFVAVIKKDGGLTLISNFYPETLTSEYFAIDSSVTITGWYVVQVHPNQSQAFQQEMNVDIEKIFKLPAFTLEGGQSNDATSVVAIFVRDGDKKQFHVAVNPMRRAQTQGEDGKIVRKSIEDQEDIIDEIYRNIWDRCYRVK